MEFLGGVGGVLRTAGAYTQLIKFQLLLWFFVFIIIIIEFSGLLDVEISVWVGFKIG